MPDLNEFRPHNGLGRLGSFSHLTDLKKLKFSDLPKVADLMRGRDELEPM